VAEMADEPLKRIEYAAPNFNTPLHFGSDTMRVLVNKRGLNPRTHVTASDWMPHPGYEDSTVRLAYGLDFGLQILMHPASVVVEEGGRTTFSVAAEGVDLRYQWRHDGRAIPKATRSTLALLRLKTEDQGSYDVVVTDQFGIQVISEPALLTVNATLAIVQQPVGGLVQSGDEITLVVKAVGPGPLTYQWRREGEAMDGGMTDRLTITGTPDAMGRYDVVIRDADENAVTSVRVKVSLVTGPPVILEHPVDLVRQVGNKAQFTTVATGEDLSYQWRKNGVVIARATGALFEIASVKEADEGSYDCVVRNGGTGILSQPAVLEVGIPLVFSLEPVDQTVAQGATVTFEVSVTNDDATYQWFFNGVKITGAIDKTLIVSRADFAKAGRYTVTATASDRQGTTGALLRVLEPGILVYKLSGTGLMHSGVTSQRVTLTGNLLIDRQTEVPQAAFVLTRKEGGVNLFEVQRLGSLFRVDSTGPAPKSQTSFTEVGEYDSEDRAVFWLQGADSLIPLPKAGTTLAPRTLSGSHLRLVLDAGNGTVLESVSLSASLDTPSTALSRQRSETLEQALQRLSTGFLQQGHVEIPALE